MAYQTGIDPETGQPYSDDLAWAFAPSSRGYRQNDTSDERDAFFAAFQFRPNDRLDINLDVQISERVQSELRNDLNFANQKRATVGITGPSLVVSPTGAVSSWAGQTAIESNSEIYSREEDYVGGGLTVAFDVSDRLTLSADASFSETTRVEQQISLRTQSDDQDIFNNDTPAELSNLGDGGYRPIVSWNLDTGIPQYTINDFDVADHTLFSDEYRVRIDSDVDRKNTVTALRTDFELRDFGWDIIPGIAGGVRISELEYLDLGPTRFETGNLDDSSQEERDTIQAINEACRDSSFPESGFLSAVGDGNLVTNIDSSTGQPTSGTGNTWATFDTWCVTNMILDYQGTPLAYPDQPRESANTVDVTETTLAAYLMADYETELAGFPLRGNFGVRVVNTEVESVGWRTEYEIVTDDGGFLSMQPVPGTDLERVAIKDDYTEVLPSVNLVVDLREDLLLRGGIFRGLSRADPSDLGYSRAFAITTDEDITDVDDLITNVDGFGNPRTQPLPSWNYDLALEWYPNEDTILAAGVYYKRFQGGFEQSRTTETFIVDGQPVNADFTIIETSEDKSELYGFEFTGTYRFSRLPGIWSGLGTKISYNYADSDFVFEDSLYGRVLILDDDGSVFSRTSRIVAPGNVPGFSEHVFSGQAYWEIGDFEVQVIYKYRSEYFQPYTSNGTRLRFIGDVGVWEARASYQLTDDVELTLEGINLFDEPKEQFFFVRDDLGEVNSYGPRIFFGLRAKF
jgi:TonB-dependent receptor